MKPLTCPRLSIRVAAVLGLFAWPILAPAAAIVFAGFEPTGDTWPGVVVTGGGVSGGTISSDNGTTTGQTPSGARIFEGTQSFQTTDGTGAANFDPIDISGFDSVVLTIHVSGTSATTGNGPDTGDLVRLYLALDGAAFPATPDITLKGNSNARWSYAATLTGSTVAGSPATFQAPQSGTNLNNYGTLTIQIPDVIRTVDLQILTNLDAAGEYYNIDSISLTGVAIPEPSTAAALLGGLGLLGGFCRRRRMRLIL